QRLHLGGDRDPIHAGRGGDHLGRAGVQAPRISEVRVEPLPEASRLPDVDHPAGAVAEPVHPRRLGDRARGGGEAASRAYHDASLSRASDAPDQLTVTVSPVTVTFSGASPRVKGCPVLGPLATEPS